MGLGCLGEGLLVDKFCVTVVDTGNQSVWLLGFLECPVPVFLLKLHFLASFLDIFYPSPPCAATSAPPPIPASPQLYSSRQKKAGFMVSQGERHIFQTHTECCSPGKWTDSWTGSRKSGLRSQTGVSPALGPWASPSLSLGSPTPTSTVRGRRSE